MKNTLTAILIWVAAMPAAIAQERVVGGTVTDTSGAPLEGTSVTWGKDSSTTGTSGSFLVTIPDTTNVIVFSHPGYARTSLPIPPGGHINVRMTPTDIYDLSLEELLQVKVSTVTLGEQEISEAPGIVTIFTSDDLEMLGIRTLGEALSLVPGFSPLQNDDEQILCVRGIFATTNQKILVMRDGFPLNEGNLDIPVTGYSITLQNVKKIEIIRGPGASIYGNSAIAAVVNIITRGNEPGEAKIQAGNYGQLNMEMFKTTTTRGNGTFQVFGRYADIGGQPRNVTVAQPAGEKPLEPTYKTGNYPNNYDLGFKFNNRYFSSAFCANQHNYTTYWTAQGLYTNVDSLLAKPGLQQKNVHVDLSFHPPVSPSIDLNFQHFADDGQLTNTRLLAAIDPARYINGRLQLNQWNVRKMGINYTCSYKLSGDVQCLAGMSLEKRLYMESWLASNTSDSSKISYSPKPFFPRGQEARGAAFLQAQYRATRWMTLDMGARYDMAQYFDPAFDPRLAIILYPATALSIKMIYTRAFQAPGYSYRTSNADYSGSTGKLEPEKLTTYQLAARYEYSEASFVEVTCYYNRLYNLITRTSANYYANFGKLSSYGVEIDCRQTAGTLAIFGNLSIVLPDTSNTGDTYLQNNIDGARFKHFPTYSANAGVMSRITRHLVASGYLQYASPFLAYTDVKVGSRIIYNTMVRLEDLYKTLDLGLNIYNLANKKYYLGDPSMVPIEQPGRWFLVSLEIDL